MVSNVRRAANPTRKISITIPGNLFNELERTLSYSQSRSRFISSAIAEKLDGTSSQSILESTTRQLMAAITARDDVDETLKHLLLQILSK
jgi:metal-responsive CopG/Arc/MetJ family transcriptional regulator